jgi:hypothetical protein
MFASDGLNREGEVYSGTWVLGYRGLQCPRGWHACNKYSVTYFCTGYNDLVCFEVFFHYSFSLRHALYAIIYTTGGIGIISTKLPRVGTSINTPIRVEQLKPEDPPATKPHPKPDEA